MVMRECCCLVWLYHTLLVVLCDVKQQECSMKQHNCSVKQPKCDFRQHKCKVKHYITVVEIGCPNMISVGLCENWSAI